MTRPRGCNVAGELRFDRHTGEWVNIVGHRQARPNLPSGGCPFCVGGIEAPSAYETRWFANRWPAFEPGAPLGRAALEGGGVDVLPAAGAAEVVLYSPEHDGSLGSLGRAQVEKVVDLWAERTAALLARPEIEYVLVFESRGAEVGATIHHPHGQIYGYPFVPPSPAAEARQATDARADLVADEPRLRPLDDHGLGEALQRAAADRGLVLSQAVSDYWLTRRPRELVLLLADLDRIDTLALAAGRRLTIPLLREALGI